MAIIRMRWIKRNEKRGALKSGPLFANDDFRSNARPTH